MKIGNKYKVLNSKTKSWWIVTVVGEHSKEGLDVIIHTSYVNHDEAKAWFVYPDDELKWNLLLETKDCVCTRTLLKL